MRPHRKQKSKSGVVSSSSLSESSWFLFFTLDSATVSSPSYYVSPVSLVVPALGVGYASEASDAVVLSGVIVSTDSGVGSSSYQISLSGIMSGMRSYICS